jgi:hypothetical protein
MNAERSILAYPPAPTPYASAAVSTPIADSVDPASVPLPSDVGVLQAMVRELLVAMRQSRHERDGLQERLALLLRKLYGPRAERLDPNQPWLLPEMAPDAANPDEAAPTADTAATDAPDADAPATTPAKKKGHAASGCRRICNASASSTR